MRKHIPAKVRREVLARFGGRCGYYGEVPSKLQVDHVRPVVHGGTDDLSNLMPACASCNNYKISVSLELFRTFVQESNRKARERSVNFRFAERYGLVTARDKKVVFLFERERACSPCCRFRSGNAVDRLCDYHELLAQQKGQVL